MTEPERSLETIRHEDLERLAELALEDLVAFFRGNPDVAAVYQDRLLCVASEQPLESPPGGTRSVASATQVPGARCEVLRSGLIVGFSSHDGAWPSCL